MAMFTVGAGKPPLKGVPLVLLTAGVALATFMEVLDISVVNVAVRTIAGDLGVSYTEGTMAISAYSLASAIMQPLTGWIAQRFGEVRSFAISVLLFIVFSIACGLAPSMTLLIVFRLCQGAVSGPLVPLSQTLLLANYPPKRRSIALALWAMMVVVAPIFGPILGGWITDNYAWPWIFFINVPVGIFALLVIMGLLHDRETRTVKLPVDAIGLGLLAIGVGALQFMLDKGNEKDWFSSELITTLGIVALVCITFLIVWEWFQRNPVVNLRLLGRRNFAAGVTCLSLGMFAFFGGVVVLPSWLQQVMQYNATWAGYAVAPVGVLALVMAPIIGVVQNRFDLRLLNTIGFVIFAACSFWMATLSIDVPYREIALQRLVMGAGIALFFVPVNQIILAGLDDKDVASASGLSNFFRTLASSVATAVSTTLYDHRTTFHHAVLAEHTHAGARTTEQYLQWMGRMGLPTPARHAALNEMVNAQAATLAVNDIFWLYGIIFLAIMGLIWFAKPPFASGAQPVG